MPSRAFSASRKQIASWSSDFGAAGPTSIRSAPGLRQAQQPSVDAMVVDDDVGRLETALTAHAHERRITWAGADDVDTRSIHGSCQSGTLTRVGCAQRLSYRTSSSSSVLLRIQCRGQPPAETVRDRSRDRSIERRTDAGAVERRDDGQQLERAIALGSAMAPSGSWHPPPSAVTSARSAASARPPPRRAIARSAARRPRRRRGSRWQQYPDRGPERTGRLESPPRCDRRSRAGGGRRRRAPGRRIRRRRACQARVHVAANGRERRAGKERRQLRDAPDAAGADGCAPSESCERVGARATGPCTAAGARARRADPRAAGRPRRSSPSGSTTGMSFALWTARSTSPRSSASSISLTNSRLLSSPGTRRVLRPIAGRRDDDDLGPGAGRAQAIATRRAPATARAGCRACRS